MSQMELLSITANLSASQDSERGWMIRVATSPSSILPSLNAIAPAGWSGRTCPVSCRRTKGGRLEPLSGGWQNSGMGSPGECLTLNTSVWTGFAGRCPSGGAVCSLSDILEDHGSVPQRYYLTPEACAGILRRAEQRGKGLPMPLRQALSQVAAELHERGSHADKTP